MKDAIFVSPSIRPLGARRSLSELLKNLPKTLTPHVIVPSMQGIALELKDLGLDVTVAPQGAWRKLGGRITAIMRQIPEIKRQIARVKPDFIHANEFHSVPQVLAASRGKYPVFGHVRLGVTQRQIQNYRLGGCVRVVTVSRAVQELFAGTPVAPKVRTVYNGVSIEQMGEGSHLNPAILEKWPDQATRPFLACLLGLVSDRKKQLVACEAVARARKFANVGVVFAGDAFGSSEAYGEQLRQRLGEPDLRDCALWVPFQKDVASLYRSTDLNLLISNEEGFGRTIIEAGSLGKPSVGTRIGGIPELIEDGRTGWLIDEGDVNALADVLVTACNNREVVAQRGEAMRRVVNEHFTIQAHVRHMMDVWQEGLDEWRRQAP